MEKITIEEFIKKQLETNSLNKYEKKSISPTKLITSEILNNEKIVSNKILKPSLSFKIQSSIYPLILFTILCLKYGAENFNLLYFFGVFYLGMIIKVWYSNDVNTISLNEKGIEHNGVFLDWKNIISTHIYTLIDKNENTNKIEKNSYLIIEFKDKIRLYEITGISTKNFIERFFDKTPDEEIVGHYVEKYKIKDSL
jgi:hypothetical protein